MNKEELRRTLKKLVCELDSESERDIDAPLTNSDTNTLLQEILSEVKKLNAEKDLIRTEINSFKDSYARLTEIVEIVIDEISSYHDFDAYFVDATILINCLKLSGKYSLRGLRH